MRLFKLKLQIRALYLLMGGLFFTPTFHLLAGGQDPHPFVVFDNTLYRNKPDLTVHGLQPCYVTGWEMFAEQWSPQIDMTRGNEAATRAWARRMAGTPYDGPNGLVVPDIEHWDIRNEPAATQYLGYMAEIVDWMKSEVPSLVVGYYGSPPTSDYWRSLQYQYGLHIQDSPEWSQWWDNAIIGFESRYREYQAESVRMRSLADHCDVILPSLYTFYEDQNGWEINAVDQIREARQYGKPVYVYLWPQFHDSSHRAFQYIEKEYWRRQLELCRREADGVVIWGGNQQTWDENALWWQETLKFMRINDQTVDARSMGAALNGLTDDSAVLQNIIDNFPSTGGRLIIDGPAGIGPQGLTIQNKSNVVIQGFGTTASLKALGSNTNFPQLDSLGKTFIRIDGAQDCFIDNLIIDGNQNQANGLGVINSQRIVIHGNKIRNFVLDPNFPLLSAIVGAGNQNNIYRENFISDVPSGIRLTHFANLPAELSPTIQHNKIYTTTLGDAISVVNQGATVLHNWIKNAAGTGIAITPAPSPNNNLQTKIKENYIKYSLGDGIASTQVPGSPLIHNVVIENNLTEENNGVGIRVIGVSQWSISDNKVINNGTGANSGPGVLVNDVQNVTIRNNAIYQWLGGQSAGLKLSVEDRIVNGQPFPTELNTLTITNNTLQGNSEDGLQIITGGNSSLNGATIQQNIIQLNNRYGVYIAGQNYNLQNLRLTRNTYSQNRVRPIRNELYAALKPVLENVDTSQAGTVAVSYEPMDGTDTYHFQVSAQPDFSVLAHESNSPGMEFSFSAEEGGTYYVRLQGSSTLDNVVEMSQWSDTTQISMTPAQARPGADTKFLPFKSVFNPKREKLAIAFNLGEAGPTSLVLFNRTGQEIAKLLDSDLGTGPHTQEWEGKNSSGDTVASGAYTVMLKNNGKTKSTKIVVLK